MMNWAHGANWRRGARRQLRPSARRAAQGTGTHLVHEHGAIWAAADSTSPG